MIATVYERILINMLYFSVSFYYILFSKNYAILHEKSCNGGNLISFIAQEP